jgi:hypothetical protein
LVVAVVRPWGPDLATDCLPVAPARVAGVTESQRITEFDELLQLLRGLIGRMVEPSVFLPQDEDGFSVMHFSGILKSVEERDGGRWHLEWEYDKAARPCEPAITIWRDRFLEALLDFSGDVEDGFEDVDESRGHNTFLKIRSKGFTLDLISYD